MYFKPKILFYILHAPQGFCVSFLTQLNRSSHKLVQTKLQQKLLGHVNGSSLLSQPLPKPQALGEDSVNFEGFWIYQGNLEPYLPPEYVFTFSVKQNLRDLARIVSGRFVEIQKSFSERLRILSHSAQKRHTVFSVIIGAVFVQISIKMCFSYVQYFCFF